MLDFSEKIEEDAGPPTALSDSEIYQIFKLSNLSESDIFFDLGSGDGEIVRQALKKRHVKEAHGIEENIKRYLMSIEYTRNAFSKKQLKKIEFWRALYQEYDFSKATVVYNGLYDFGTDEEIDVFDLIYKKKKKPFKIIKRDLPLFPYEPINAHRDKKESWFFLMKSPLKEYKINNKNKWAQLVLDEKDSTINDVYNYYRRKLETRFREEGSSQKDAKKEANSCVRDFQRLVNKRFPSK